MPKDGSISRKRILDVAKREFLDKGFEGASIREIGRKAELSSAALYRHFKNKEEIFAALVEPGVQALDAWVEAHEAAAYEDVEGGRVEQAATRSDVDAMRDVVFPQRDTFKLLVCCAAGTQYENYLHHLVESQQAGFKRGITWMKKKGFPVKRIDDGALHMMMSAYTTALFEPIVHDYPQKDAMRYYQVMERFFLPGWRDIMGV